VARFVAEHSPEHIAWCGSEDSHAIDRVGTLAKLHGVMAALLSEIENGGMAAPAWPPFRTPTLGVPRITVGRFYDLARVSANTGGTRQLVSWDCVGTGIEAQVHGSVVLTRDVERLVADPAFTGTSVGRMLNELAAKYGFELQWHCGPSPIVRPKYAWRPNIIRTDHRFPACDGCVNEALIS